LRYLDELLFFNLIAKNH